MKVKNLSLLLSSLGFACVALSPKAQAVSPPPDGGYGLNTAEGTDALFSLTTGVWNTAIGFQALYAETTGLDNTATGGRALFSNTGSQNTANGAYALFYNTYGAGNSAFGWGALASGEGSFNTAIGYGALQFNTGSAYNVAIGWQAFLNLNNNHTGNDNVAVGSAALWHGSTGDRNIAIGRNALDGRAAGPPGSGNIAIGAFAGHYVNGDNNIIIGSEGKFMGGLNGAITIGSSQTATYIAGIWGQQISNGLLVYIDPQGHLGTNNSSARFKRDIKPMESASEALFSLKPVTFRYKEDPVGISQFGLVAEDVEKVNPDLVARDKEGEPYSVRYDQVNAMLLNEFLKDHRKVEQLEKQIEALSAALQKVSTQLEVSKPAQQTVVNN